MKTKWRHDVVIAEWLHEVNTGCSSGLYFGRDEVEYCQRKYDKALMAAVLFDDRPYGTIDLFAEFIRATIHEEDRIVLPAEDTERWPAFFVLVQELQTCTFEDFTRYENEFEWPGEGAEGMDLQRFIHKARQVDAYNEAVAEICQLNAVLMASSKHC